MSDILPEPFVVWLTLDEAAIRLDLAPEVVLHLALVGDLEGRVQNGRELISQQSIEAWLLRREGDPLGLALDLPPQEPSPQPDPPAARQTRPVVRRWVPGKGLWPPVRARKG